MATQRRTDTRALDTFLRVTQEAQEALIRRAKARFAQPTAPADAAQAREELAERLESQAWLAWLDTDLANDARVKRAKAVAERKADAQRKAELDAMARRHPVLEPRIVLPEPRHTPSAIDYGSKACYAVVTGMLAELEGRLNLTYRRRMRREQHIGVVRFNPNAKVVGRKQDRAVKAQATARARERRAVEWLGRAPRNDAELFDAAARESKARRQAKRARLAWEAAEKAAATIDRLSFTATSDLPTIASFEG